MRLLCPTIVSLPVTTPAAGKMAHPAFHLFAAAIGGSGVFFGGKGLVNRYIGILIFRHLLALAPSAGGEYFMTLPMY